MPWMLVKFAGAAVALSLLAPPASNAIVIKPGSSCKQVGVSRWVSGKKFTCSKVGKRLEWKVVNVPKVPLTPSPASPSPAASTPPVTRQTAALAALKAAMVPKPPMSTIRYHYSPNINASFRDFLVKDLDEAMRYWADVYTNPEPFNVFYGTENDLNWLIEAWRPYGFDKHGGFADDLRGRIAREGKNLNAGAVPSESGPGHLSILRSSTRTMQSGDYSFVTHEAVHIVQQYLSQYRTADFPCWLREGSANLFGNFMGVEMHGANYDDLKRGDMNNYLWGSSGVELRAYTAEQWLVHLQDLEGSFSRGCDYVNRFAYGSGLLLSEVLIADFGFEKMMDFWRSFGTGKGLRPSFREIYAVEIDDWYKLTAIPYVMSEYARVRR